jgi:LCP family protein required for cell wall assembly
MMNEDKNQKHLKIAVTSALVAILFFMTGFTFVFKKNHENLLNRDLQINSLAGQINVLKDENDQIRGFISDNNTDLKDISAAVTSLNGALNDSLTEKNQAIADARTKLEALEKDLTKNIADRELTINELAQKNIKLKNELQMPKTGEEVKSFLLIGQNSGLTDSIIVAAVNPLKQTVSLVNIPRDLYYKGHKINEIYEFYGTEKLYDAVYEITGLKAEKYAIFSFDAFVKTIDGLGGLDINVKKDIIDNQYPGENFSYTLVSFKQGIQHMDGITALKYVRSRKSTSDFDRSARQQQVIAAIKQKINNLNLVSQLPAYMSLYEGIQELLKTDVSAFEALAYYDKYKNYAVESGNVLSNSNFLYSKTASNGQYILLPTGGDYAKIKEYVADLVNN